MTIKEIAHQLHLPPQKLEQESLRVYLDQKLRHIEAEIFRIASRHEVKDVFQLDQVIQSGKIKEEEGWEDFFELDNLESQRKQMRSLLEKL